MRWTIVFVLLNICCSLQAQEYRWQQRVEYTMNVHLDVKTHLLKGTQRLVYYNNSPDTLTRVFYHLYFNAFQPGSMMDVRSRNIADPDKRVADRISKLTPEETGYQKIKTLKQNGAAAHYRIDGTIMEVMLPSAIYPGTKTVFELEFEAQVPIQIRRCGHDNKEGVAYSITQWYPKMAEYDQLGWHAYQYVAREFHGVWGDYDVTLSLDPSFVVAGTGVIQNPDVVGHGYESAGAQVKYPRKKDLSWHFVAKNVHDFAWAADPDYAHDRIKVPDGPELHFFYRKHGKTDHWRFLPQVGVALFDVMNHKFGKYPFETYSVIQGGDGGMEYPMCTLIAGEGTLDGTAGTMIHEVAHSWFQMALASNESLYAWMDEGFTRFAELETKGVLLEIPKPFTTTYEGYKKVALAGKEEPSSQFSDFFTLNEAYKIGSYFKGCLMLNQLRYIMGEANFWKGIRKYYDTWKFHHPEPNDFIRTMERASGLQLKWFMNYWIYTTKQIDYGIKEITAIDNNTTRIVLERKGELPMPMDVLVTYKDGSQELCYIPLNETLGSKPTEGKRTEFPGWAWVAPTYSFTLPHDSKDILRVEIDPAEQLADVKRENNVVDYSGAQGQSK